MGWVSIPQVYWLLSICADQISGGENEHGSGQKYRRSSLSTGVLWA
jgi:hypothetical protein